MRVPNGTVPIRKLDKIDRLTGSPGTVFDYKNSQINFVFFLIF
jgi:hypothetical protein